MAAPGSDAKEKTENEQTSEIAKEILGAPNDDDCYYFCLVGEDCVRCAPPLGYETEKAREARFKEIVRERK
jgi:hypothetical protein